MKEWLFPIIRNVRFVKFVPIKADTYDEALDKLDALLEAEQANKQPLSLEGWTVEQDITRSQGL
jgi:hypothetical protein